MKIEVDTEIEELAELRAAVAIIEDAIKRREGKDYQEEDYQEEQEEDFSEAQTTMNTTMSEAAEPSLREEEEPEVKKEEPKVFPEKPQVAQISQVKREAPPSVDMSALSKSDYGSRMASRSSGSSSPMRGMEQQTKVGQPSMMRQPAMGQSIGQSMQNNKTVVRNIIQTLKDRNRGGPIQMYDIIRMAREKSINEQETRNLVQELQRAGSV